MRLKEKIFREIQRTKITDQFVHEHFHLAQLFRAFRKQIICMAFLNRKSNQVESVHKQLIKYNHLKAWKTAFYMSLAINKVAVPFNSTMLFKKAFFALRDNVESNKKAREFNKRALLIKAMSRLYLYSKRSQKCCDLKNRVKSREIYTIFRAFTTQINKLSVLR